MESELINLPLLEEEYALSSDQLTQFREDGFLKASNVFDAKTLAYFEPEITRLTVANNQLDGIPMQERDTYSKAFIQVGNLWEKSKEVRRLTFSRRLAAMATALLGSIGVRLWHDQSLYKEQSGKNNLVVSPRGMLINNIGPWQATSQ